ncbi:uncharacterized protein [Dysidea avara]|uniref:uncharacterized protein isoform X2 n=1 Tax=Dysidea avara TaxID=196820 RepID=UPI003332ED20
MARFVYRVLKLASSSGRIRDKTVGSDNGEFINIKGIIFDMDGTLTLPVYDGRELLKRLPLPPDTNDILVSVMQLDGPKRTKAMRTIEQYEEEMEEKTELQPHVLKLLHFIASNGVKLALVTRNTLKGTKVFLDLLQAEADKDTTHSVVMADMFSQIITRDNHSIPTKPDPAPVMHICSHWGLSPGATLMVGDDWKDIMCGNKAGSVTVLLRNHRNHDHPSKAKPNFVVDSLSEIISLLQSPFTIEV